MKVRLAFLVALMPLLIAASSVRIMHYGGNTATITTTRQLQHIVVRDGKGNLESETWCDWQSGTFDEIVALGESLKRAANHGDRRAIVSLMRFPLRINTGPERGYSIASPRALLARYNAILTPRIIAALRQNEPQDVFCRNGMSWVAGGLMWSTADRPGVLRVAVINE